VPLPKAVVYIDLPDNSEIIKRLRNRNKIISAHNGIGDEALQKDIENWRYAQHLILEKIKQAGVSVIRLNGHQPVKENVARITELLKNTGTTRDAESAKSKKVSMMNLITQSC